MLEPQGKPALDRADDRAEGVAGEPHDASAVGRRLMDVLDAAAPSGESVGLWGGHRVVLVVPHAVVKASESVGLDVHHGTERRPEG